MEVDLRLMKDIMSVDIRKNDPKAVRQPSTTSQESFKDRSYTGSCKMKGNIDRYSKAELQFLL